MFTFQLLCEIMMMKLFVYISLKSGGRENSNSFFKKKFFTLPLYVSISGAAIVIHCQFWVVLLKLVDVFVGACRFLVVRLFYSASCGGFQLG